MSSYTSNENIHKKEDGSYYEVLANIASSVTPLSPGYDAAMKARKFTQTQMDI